MCPTRCKPVLSPRRAGSGNSPPRTATRCSGLPGIPLLCIAATLFGCSSPPSVVPLMRAAEQTLNEERRLVDEDRARRTALFERRRDALAAGYEADLAERETLDPAWVLEGTRAYTAAREALLRHEMELERRATIRKQNLELAGAALERGVALIQQRDRLLERLPVLGEWTGLRSSILREQENAR